MESNPERWLPVVGYKGLYEVSDLGRVRGKVRLITDSMGRQYYRPGRILCFSHDSRGYKIVILCKDCGRQAKLVHRLVMQSFVGPCPEGMNVCHGTGGKTDNRLVNLSYGTKSKNNGVDKLRDGTDNRGEKHGAAKLTQADVLAIRASNRPEAALAALYGVGQSQIGRIRRQERWTWLQAPQQTCYSSITHPAPKQNEP